MVEQILVSAGLEHRNIFFISVSVSLLLSLRSERKIMSVPRSVIHLIFLSCLGQLVETFRELQFYAEQVRFCKIVVRVRAAGRGPPAAGF